jgi:hypothetical protein
MKTYGEWRYRSVILDLSTRRRSVVSFTPRLLYFQGNSPRYPLYKRLVEPQSRSAGWGIDKNPLPPPFSQPLYQLSYTGSQLYRFEQQLNLLDKFWCRQPVPKATEMHPVALQIFCRTASTTWQISGTGLTLLLPSHWHSTAGISD